ncbi:galactose-3-O-sulfotransferase 2-like [Branchiostoma floridae x Branchiostoma belcheri]
MRKDPFVAFLVILAFGGVAWLASFSDVAFTDNSLQHLALDKRSDVSTGPLGHEDRKGESHNTSEKSQQQSSKDCVPKKHFVWIKVHKAGSQTTTPLFERFAFNNHLKVLLGVHNGPSVSWPLPPKEGKYVQLKEGEPFDALYSHSRYNKTWMEAHFPTDTAYLAIVKQPFTHFKSCFHYYGVSRKIGIKQTKDKNPLRKFLENPWKYKTEAMSQGIRWDKTRNAQLFDLGFPMEKSEDMEWTEKYIAQLDRDFLLVIILEYHDESLILLKRLMCWTLYDVLLGAASRNSRDYGYKYYKPTPEEEATYRKYAAAEYAMYKRFNQSLWEKISQQSPDFFQEVENYRKVTQQVREFCKKGKDKVLVVADTPWNREYKLPRGFCSDLKTNDPRWRSKSWQQLGYPPRGSTGELFNARLHLSKFLKAARDDSKEKKPR